MAACWQCFGCESIVFVPPFWLWDYSASTMLGARVSRQLVTGGSYSRHRNPIQNCSSSFWLWKWRERYNNNEKKKEVQSLGINWDLVMMKWCGGRVWEGGFVTRIWSYQIPLTGAGDSAVTLLMSMTWMMLPGQGVGDGGGGGDDANVRGWEVQTEKCHTSNPWPDAWVSEFNWSRDYIHP